MKRVLITGANSYVGTNVEKWLMKEPENFYVETLDMRDPNWKNFDFSKFDVVFHVAGIAHKKIKRKDSKIYYEVNTELTKECGERAISQGVKHFIFMSTMAVYNDKEVNINKNTIPNPQNDYGRSKLDAEKALSNIYESSILSILRPPIIYGPYSPGNFMKLNKLATKFRVFPNIENKKSMLYIVNFCIQVKKIIEREENGILHLQNLEYVSTTKLVKLLAKEAHNKVYTTSILNIFIKCMCKYNKTFRKLFSDHYYDKEIVYSNAQNDLIDFNRSIYQTINCMVEDKS